MQWQVIARYLIVGLMNTGAGYGIFAVSYLGLRNHLPYVLIVLISHVLAVSFAFLTQGRLVFRSGWPRSRAELMRAWMRSQSGYLGILALGLLIHGLVVGVLEQSAWWAQAWATLVAVLAGWFLNQHVVFGSGSERER